MYFVCESEARRTSLSMSSFSLMMFAANSHTTIVSVNGMPVSNSSTHFSNPSLLYIVTRSGADWPSCSDLAAMTAAISACNSASSCSSSERISSALRFLFPSFFPMFNNDISQAKNQSTLGKATAGPSD